MDTKQICTICGKTLAASAPEGLCPECLLKAGIGSGVDIGTETEPGASRPGFVPPSVAELAPLFPQLEILELVGKGGMGAVYKARQKALNRFVALKILPPGIGREAAFAARFTREAQALALLNHPGIVTLYEFGETSGQFYFLMEYVDGVNLRQLLHAGRISAREALAIVPQICDALQFAHDQGIVHRDIKPENILMDRRGRVKVADFGLAKIVGDVGQAFQPAGAGDFPVASTEAGTSGASGNTGLESPVNRQAGKPALRDLTDAGKVMGTPQYMSPEQITAPGEVDHRADIYALGVVFYQMLTGELPGKKIEPPSKKVQVDVRLDEVVLRALEKKPELRYQQASVLKTEVETIAMGSAGVAPAEPGVAPGSRETQMDERADGATPSAARVTCALPEPRFSRTAIVGAAWLTLFFAVVPAFLWHEANTHEFERHGPFSSPLMVFVFFVFIFPAFVAPLGTTILGWVAVSQIRRSAGKIYGLGLAVFDELLFPLLAVTGLITWLWWWIFRLLLYPRHIDALRMGDSVQVSKLQDLVYNHWLALTTISTFLTGGIICLLLIRRVWRAVNQPVNEQANQTTKPKYSWNWLRLVVVPLVFLLVALVVWGFSSRYAAWKQEKLRIALQHELGNLIGTLLAEKRTTLSMFGFARESPNAPWEVVVHCHGMESWRDPFNQPLAPPRKIKGNIVLNYQPPNEWSARGTGDLIGCSATWHTVTRGFPDWPQSDQTTMSLNNPAPPYLRVTVRVLDVPASFDEAQLLRPSGLLDGGGVKILAAPYVVVRSGDEVGIQIPEIPSLLHGFSHVLSGRTKTLYVKPMLEPGTAHVRYTLEGDVRGTGAKAGLYERLSIRSDSLQLGEMQIMESNSENDRKQLAVISVEMEVMRQDAAGNILPTGTNVAPSATRTLSFGTVVERTLAGDPSLPPTFLNLQDGSLVFAPENKLVQQQGSAKPASAPSVTTNLLPPLTGESSRGLRLECRPIAARFTTNQIVGISCRVINTTSEMKPVGWSSSAGAHFCLTPKSEPYYGGILPKALPQLDGSLTVRDGYTPYSMKIVYLPPGGSVEFHLDCGYWDKPKRFEGRIVYDPLSSRNGYFSTGGDRKPPWADQLISSENFTFEVVADVGTADTITGAMQPGRFARTETITIAADGSVTVAGVPCPVEQLAERVKQLAARQPVTVEIRADRAAPFKWVVAVMDACKAAGIQQVSKQQLNQGLRSTQPNTPSSP
jgi:predicted Ser/Thr protein kinase